MPRVSRDSISLTIEYQERVSGNPERGEFDTWVSNPRLTKEIRLNEIKFGGISIGKLGEVEIILNRSGRITFLTEDGKNFNIERQPMDNRPVSHNIPIRGNHDKSPWPHSSVDWRGMEVVFVTCTNDQTRRLRIIPKLEKKAVEADVDGVWV